jgi:hypothetical protein
MSVHIDAIESSKENIQPVKRGRNAKDLLEMLKKSAQLAPKKLGMPRLPTCMRSHAYSIHSQQKSALVHSALRRVR